MGKGTSQPVEETRSSGEGEFPLCRKSEREKRKVGRQETEKERSRPRREASAINQLPSVEFFAAALLRSARNSPPAVVNHYDLYYYFRGGRKIIALQEASKTGET